MEKQTKAEISISDIIYISVCVTFWNSWHNSGYLTISKSIVFHSLSFHFKIWVLFRIINATFADRPRPIETTMEYVKQTQKRQTDGQTDS